mmetsp:Transcript_2248/g.2426  ORF Transcript_2248/g.2426 Transcript_2248/m.2426 type:complete len:81 (+) Transcript_2248:685-927(+)
MLVTTAGVNKKLFRMRRLMPEKYLEKLEKLRRVTRCMKRLLTLTNMIWSYTGMLMISLRNRNHGQNTVHDFLDFSQTNSW